MIRWVAAIFTLLAIFYPLLPFLAKIGVGRMPADLRFRFKGIIFCLPFGSALICSLLAFLAAKLAHLV